MSQLITEIIKMDAIEITKWGYKIARTLKKQGETNDSALETVTEVLSLSDEQIRVVKMWLDQDLKTEVKIDETN